MNNETKGMVLGLIGVSIFALTLPMTRMAVTDLSPLFVSIGRVVLASGCAVFLAAVFRLPFPRKGLILALLGASAGVIFGFPILTAWAMDRVPANHGAVLLGILPLATAVFGVILDGDRPSKGFWFCALAGSAAVIVYAALEGGLTLLSADIALLCAVVAAGFGYAMGGRISREIGGWQTITWILIITLPVTSAILAFEMMREWPSAEWSSWGAFVYLALFSQFIGFFAWYAGLAIGGVARVGQVQLLQTFLTFAGAAVLLGEMLDARTMTFALLVIVLVWIGRRMPIKKAVAIPL